MAAMTGRDQDIDVDLGALFAGILRNWKAILGAAIGIALVAFLLASLATPHYQAETRILIETRESVFTRPGGSQSDQPILDEEGVTSQVEVISSTDLLKSVARKLDLSRYAEFDPVADLSLLDRALIVVGLKSDPSDIPADERVLKAFREKLTVYRVERSRVIVVSFSSEDPKLAAEVPNAVADAYIALQRSAKQESNADATGWLEPEIAALRQRVQEAEKRVADFRAGNDLLISQNNAVLPTQQLSEQASELSRVRASRAAAEAKAQSMRAALDAGAAIDTMPDVLASGLIQRLRERQVQLKADIADLSTTLLSNHPRIRALNAQLADLDQQIRSEGQKVLRSLETEVKTAQARERELTAEVNRLKADAAKAGDQEVELRALEREAASQRDLLESYLTRYREAASRTDGNYLPADARIFSRAITPAEPYFPKVFPIVSAAFIGSLLLISLGMLLRELFSGRAMRPAAGVRVAPIESIVMPGAAADPAVASAPASRADEISVALAAERLIARGASRAVVVSPEGDEAAATSILLAREVSDAGLRVLLLDLTASGAASLPMLDTLSKPGITNLLAAEAQFADIIHADHYSDCHVIPVGTADAARAMRGADRLPIILNSLTTAYDLVVVECGPADAAALKRLAGQGTELVVSFIDGADDAVEGAASELRAAGYGEPMMVSPAGLIGPDPVPDRDAA